MDGLECSEILLSSLERTARIDAEFYKKENLQVAYDLSRIPLESFTKHFFVSDGNHMSISNSFCSEGIPYYRGKDIYNVFIEESNPTCITRDTFLNPHMKRSHLKRGDVLMSIVGAIIGNSAIVSSDDEATCSCKLAIMRSKGSEIIPETLLSYIKTEYGQNQIQKFKRGTAQTGLLLEDFDQLLIPKFSHEFQKKIKHTIEKAYEFIKKGDELYKNTNDFLLNILNFDESKLSSKNTSVKKLSESTGIFGRLDAEFYQEKYDDFDMLLKSTNTVCLGDIVEIFKSIEPGSDCYSDQGIPFARVSDISAMGIESPSVKIHRSSFHNIEKLFPKKDTILLSKDGSVAIAYKMEECKEIVTSSAILHLNVKDKELVLPDYLTLVLNSRIVQMQAERNASGAIIKHWRLKDIENVLIPVISIDMQTNLSLRIQKAFLLRKKGLELIDATVDAIERAIKINEYEATSYISSFLKGI